MLVVKEIYRRMPCYTVLNRKLIGIGGIAYKPSTTGRLEIAEATPSEYEECYKRGQTGFFEDPSDLSPASAVEAVEETVIEEEVVEEEVSEEVIKEQEKDSPESAATKKRKRKGKGW